MTEKLSYHDEVFRVVRQIPRGHVATYGQVARLVPGCTPRMVGFAMAAVRDEDGVPWHRVLNSYGEVSTRAAGDGAARQRRRLRAEGVRFDARQRVSLDDVGWLPRD